MRVFVGSLLDAPHQQACRVVIATLLAAGGGRLRSIPEDTAHVTCAFVASLPETNLATLEATVGSQVASMPPFDVQLGPPTVQYAGREARLVYLPMTVGGDAFTATARALTEAISRALPDVPVSGTREPHVTLARYARGTSRRDARRTEEVIARELASVRIGARIAAVQVVESQLTPAGARYVVRATSRLGR